MIAKQVSVTIEALGRTATVARVKEFSNGVYVFDLLDGGEELARSRYAFPHDAPFTLNQADIDAMAAVQ